MSDFNLNLISGTGFCIRVALYSEEDGVTCLKTFRDAGAKVRGSFLVLAQFKLTMDNSNDTSSIVWWIFNRLFLLVD